MEAAVAIAAMGALGHVFPTIASGWPLAFAACGAIVGMVLVNITGARSTGVVQVTATLIKIVPLLLVALLVLVRIVTGPALEPLAPVPLSIGATVSAAGTPPSPGRWRRRRWRRRSSRVAAALRPARSCF